MDEGPERSEDRTDAASTDADQEHLARLRRQRQARVAKAIVVLAIVILLLVFVTQNLEEVPVDFVFVTASFPLIWVLIVTAILGGAAGYLLGRPSKGTRLHRERDEG